MLRSFRVANHKSFRDETELLLMPAYDRSRQVVPVAAVFGANASGKSNLLDALRWLQVAVRESYAAWEPGAGIPRTPFRLDPEVAARPSLYCVELLLDGQRYTYGVEVDDHRVLSEWLYTYPRNRRRMIFYRDRNAVSVGSTVPDHRARAQQLDRQTRDNALLLSVAAHNDVAEVQPVYGWFRKRLRFAADTTDLAGRELLQRLSDKAQRPAIVALVSAADLGITDITGHEQAAAWTTASELREVLTQLTESSQPPAQPAEAAVGRGFVAQLREILEQGQDSGLGRLRFKHGSSSVLLGLEDQSAGTRNWIALVSAALTTLSAGGVLVVDEVDASLHPHLSARLINLFRDVESNRDCAQLVLTTHDATLLDEETLSRDEVWFVEKAPDSGASRLYPLTDFHPRKHEDTEGRYLAGSYGAIPIVSETRIIGALRGGVRDAAA